MEIAGKPILTWSAEAFDAVGDIGLIVVVCPEDRQEEYLKRAIDPFPFVTPVVMAPAGPSRQESAFSGLEYVPDTYAVSYTHLDVYKRQPYHNPEFTTMEFYQAFSDLEGMMGLTQGVVQAAAQAACGTLQIEYQGQQVDLGGTWRRATMIELASAGAGDVYKRQARLRDERLQATSLRRASAACR